MKIYYDQSPMGFGKTQNAINSITSRKCNVLFITERIESFAELRDRISQSAAKHSTHPTVACVHSGTHRRNISVAREVEALPDHYRSNDHVIVLATHAAMLRSDFSNFSDWEIIVDEVPQFLDFEEKCTHLDHAFFQRFYRLHQLTAGWSIVEATDAGLALTPADIRRDESHNHLATFHGRVLEASREGSKRRVLCNLKDWEGMADREIQWCWASAFSLWELAAFAKVTLLGNRFRSDVGSQISETLNIQSIEWVELPSLKGRRNFQSRRVHISYFSDHRKASRFLFDSEKGRAMLVEIGKRLAQELRGHGHIWTANDQKMATVTPRTSLEIGGLGAAQYISPRQAGTNSHREISHAAIIYSAKASPNLVSLLNVLGIDRSEWERSVEYETILQFATRTSVRDEGNSSPVHLWVFDREQANYLKKYFESLEYVTTTCAKVEDGPVVPSLEMRGPKRPVRTPDEQAEYLAEKRARDAARKRLARERSKMKKAA